MENLFSDRISDVPRSFIREILKVAVDPEIISFAGGLPNREFFPVEAIRQSCDRVLTTAGTEALQYSTTEGYAPLRVFIAERYKKRFGFTADPNDIIITNGSQQGLDLLGKTLLNEKDPVIIERPGYLGAIQALSVYRASFNSVPLNEEGVDTKLLARTASSVKAKLFYAVPNFQNPSGISYSERTRREAASILSSTGTLFIEDDPYGELRFTGCDLPSMKQYLPEQTVMLGSFSKIFAPSFRLGWIYAGKPLMEKITIAKQASDLHTNYFSQRVLYQYLLDNNIDEHIATIRTAYGEQKDAMVSAIERLLPKEVRCTRPDGGMFLWLTLPEEISSMKLFDAAIAENVAFVPGNPFYAPGDESHNTLRLNFTNTDAETTRAGIERLARAFKRVQL